jgi:LacI family transcriptional regulator
MPTIRDVAKRLNLSITTVSRALDGYSDVAEKTRQLVVKTAQEMGYTPNRAARQLRRQRTDTIGYILPAQAPNFSDPFFSEFIAGLGDEATSHDYDLLVSTAPADSDNEHHVYRRWAEGRKVDGLILNRMRLHDWRVQFLSQAGLPFVSLEHSLDKVDQAYIEVDGLTGFEMLMNHLIGKGYRRIAYIGGPLDLKIQADRFAGYLEGLKAARISYNPRLVVEGDTFQDGGYQAALQLFKHRPLPEAVTCVNDLTAIGALHAAHEYNLLVGRDLAVAGFDGIADGEHTNPPLTTINQPVYEIARNLVRMLITLIFNQKIMEEHVNIKPELIIRESTGR